MNNTGTDWIQMSDAAIVKQLGYFIKQTRLRKNQTQSQLSERAGLNRWTISQIENGEAVTLMSLIQILRALDSLHVLSVFEVRDEISPLEYLKVRKKQKIRVRNKTKSTEDKTSHEW